MKRLVCLFAALFVVAIVFPRDVDAQRKKKEVRFVKESASIDEKGKLELEFKLSGLKEYEKIEYEVVGDVTVTEACMNNGGNFPSDPKKQEEEGPVLKQTEDMADVKGTVEGKLSVEPVETTLECSGQQEKVLIDVEYDVKMEIKLEEEVIVKEYVLKEEYYILK